MDPVTARQVPVGATDIEAPHFGGILLRMDVHAHADAGCARDSGDDTGAGPSRPEDDDWRPAVGQRSSGDASPLDFSLLPQNCA